MDTPAIKFTFDTRGNVIRQTYHGVNGEPVFLNDGYHGWEATYDERGQQLQKSYIGVDGKPIGRKLGEAKPGS